MKDVRGKVFLVTGGARGMGRLVAERFARDGARVILWDVDGEGLEVTAKGLRAGGREVHTYAVDVSDREQVYESAERVRDEVGAVDVVMNNAGIVRGGDFLDVDEEWHAKTMEVNFNSCMWVTRAFLPDMMARNEGYFINVASVGGLIGVPMLTSYCASKAAVVNFTEALYMELKRKHKDGIKFTIVCPSFVKTGMFDGVSAPMWVSLMEPDYVADKIYGAYHRGKLYLREPFLVRLLPVWKALVPRSLYDEVFRRMGMSRSMKTWRGR